MLLIALSLVNTIEQDIYTPGSFPCLTYMLHCFLQKKTLNSERKDVPRAMGTCSWVSSSVMVGPEQPMPSKPCPAGRMLSWLMEYLLQCFYSNITWQREAGHVNPHVPLELKYLRWPMHPFRFPSP